MYNAGDSIRETLSDSIYDLIYSFTSATAFYMPSVIVNLTPK